MAINVSDGATGKEMKETVLCSQKVEQTEFPTHESVTKGIRSLKRKQHKEPNVIWHLG